jgi:hypothetical protein
MSITNIDYKDLRRKLEAPYFVQWVTEFDDNNHILRVVGSCVRNHKTGETVFKHKEPNVCQKIADMLNEEEEHNKC